MELVPYLLKLLEGIGLETLDNPSATKAQIVKALKSMTRSLQFGEQVRQGQQRFQFMVCDLFASETESAVAWQVNEILARSSVWSAFKDQKHDLFISENQTAGYLTGKAFPLTRPAHSYIFLTIKALLGSSSDCLKGRYRYLSPSCP